jgi:hypothetical protein
VTVDAQTIIEFSKLIGALGIIFGVGIGVIKWFSRHEKHGSDIEELHNQHDKDLKDVQDELCVLNYAVLAALDALKQQGYNGGVTEARDKLEKHINQKAHRQE